MLSDKRNVGEKDYIKMVLEMATSMWGSEVAQRICEHLEQTGKAVWAVSNFQLGSEVEPITVMRLEEK